MGLCVDHSLTLFLLISGVILYQQALNDKLYVTGGLGLIDKMPNSWDIYDKGTNSWFAHKNPVLTPDSQIH
jgi:hypothetical protein